MLVISLIASALLLLITNVWVRWSPRGKLGSVCWLSGIACAISMGCLFPVLTVNFFLLTFVALACLCTGARAQVFLGLSLAVTLFTYGFFAAVAYSALLEQDSLRAEYPFESMGDRLAHEGPRRERRTGAGTARKPTVVAGVASEPTADNSVLVRIEKHLDEKSYSSELRSWFLQRLHHQYVQQFIDSPGFGVGRRITPSKHSLEIPEADPIPFPASDDDSVSAGSLMGEQWQMTGRDSDHFQKSGEVLDVFAQIHVESLVDFVNARGFGYVKDRDHVAGFQSHRFTKLPEVTRARAGTGRWQIVSLELVSLLKHEQPRVYLSKNLPRMDELRRAGTRPLDAFENTSLAALERGKDLQVRSTTDRIRILGSIRAATQCLKCHDVERGDLLGAFSYTLRRVSMIDVRQGW
jgi:hypothetical protein